VTERKRTKEEERAYAALLHEIEDLKRWQDLLLLAHETRALKLKAEVIPAGWHRVEKEVPVRPKKIRVTAAYEEDLVKWFRAMGHNYQARMNAVLKAYMLAVKSREIESRKNTDWKGEPI
jgi:uncharacterized protein (DUF4415 family)